MAKEARLQSLLDELNEHLRDVTPYKLALVDPRAIQPVEKNAHYMPKRVFSQLKENIAKDGNLSTLPFCWKKKDGTFVVLSGNHRVKAAIDAGITQILVLYTDAELSRSEALAIQLSHNALVGKDNPEILVELWREIDDINAKIYTGLDENIIGTYERVAVVRPVDQPLQMVEISFFFVEPEIEALDYVVRRLPTAHPGYVADYSLFDEFFDALLDLKDDLQIVSTSTAIRAMIDIVNEYLEKKNEQKERESQAGAATTNGSR